MRPDNTPVPSNEPRGSVTPPVRDHTAQHGAVASMTREQINQIYNQQHANTDGQQGAVSSADQTSVYHRTHGDTQHQLSPEWKQYHTSWQQYYQKYYEKYYVNEAQRAHQTYQQHLEQLQQQSANNPVPPADEELSEDEALYDLRSKLRSKVQESAKKVRKSRHFVPLVSGLAVLLVFAFIQYNSTVFGIAAAYVSPGNIDPQNIIVDPNNSAPVSKESRLIIPKINVDIKVDYGAKNCNECKGGQLDAMKSGVAYFGIPGANSKPGQLGNVPISGHSSNDVFADGSNEAKFIFARLSALTKGDVFYLNYNGTRYTYNVTNTMVVLPNEVTKLQVGKSKAMATLITCTPLGTAEKRLLVFAEQVSPSPQKATQAPTDSGATTQDVKLAGKSPTLFESLFGGGR